MASIYKMSKLVLVRYRPSETIGPNDTIGPVVAEETERIAECKEASLEAGLVISLIINFVTLGLLLHFLRLRIICYRTHIYSNQHTYKEHGNAEQPVLVAMPPESYQHIAARPRSVAHSGPHHRSVAERLFGSTGTPRYQRRSGYEGYVRGPGVHGGSLPEPLQASPVPDTYRYLSY